MILTCPNCQSQFKVKPDLIGDDGRKVRCTSCTEIWFQEPINAIVTHDEGVEDEGSPSVDDVSIDDEITIDEPSGTEEHDPHDIDLIDEGEDANISISDLENDTEAVAKEKLKKPKVVLRSPQKQKQLISYAIAASVFVIILSYLLLNSSSIIKRDPAMQTFYAMFGLVFEVPGKDLVFSNVSVQKKGHDVILNGNIVNLASESRELPNVYAVLSDEHGQEEGWIIEPALNQLEGEQKIGFMSVHPAQDFHADDLNVSLRFALHSKIDVKAGDNNQAHPESDHPNDHPNDPEAHVKSHQPVSSQPHQEPSHPNYSSGH